MEPEVWYCGSKIDFFFFKRHIINEDNSVTLLQLQPNHFRTLKILYNYIIITIIEYLNQFNLSMMIK